MTEMRNEFRFTCSQVTKIGILDFWDLIMVFRLPVLDYTVTVCSFTSKMASLTKPLILPPHPLEFVRPSFLRCLPKGQKLPQCCVHTSPINNPCFCFSIKITKIRFPTWSKDHGLDTGFMAVPINSNPESFWMYSCLWSSKGIYTVSSAWNKYCF